MIENKSSFSLCFGCGVQSNKKKAMIWANEGAKNENLICKGLKELVLNDFYFFTKLILKNFPKLILPKGSKFFLVGV